MRHERFAAWALATPWALMPETMTAFARMFAVKFADTGASDEVHAGPAPRKTGQRAGAIAVIPVQGAIVQRASQLDLCAQGTSTQMVSNMLADANADDSVSQILLDIDSPGGSVYGVQELADEIRASAKPVIAIANSLAASAAYWLGSAASEFHITPGGEVGSIGVWSAHEDWSKALEDSGVKVTLISAGEFKTEGNPYQPLAADAQTFMQSRVDDYYKAFTSAVAKGRKVGIDQVRSDMGKGRVFGAQQALSANMVDSVSTFDQVIARMQKSMRQPQPNRLARAQRDISIMG